MTAKDLLPKPGFIRERIWIWLTSIALTTAGALILALFTPIVERAQAVWHSPETNAEGFATINERLDRQAAAIAELTAGVKRATGEDRVIRQTPGLSYVAEPVYQGETVVLYMVAERTTLGRDCRLMEWVPLFTDETGVSMPGSGPTAASPKRQITNTPTRLMLEIQAPDKLRPGRIELYLALTYNCNGAAVYDKTAPVVYEMLEGYRP